MDVIKEKKEKDLLCKLCNGSKTIKYKELDEFTSRRWAEWKTRDCPKCK